MFMCLCYINFLLYALFVNEAQMLMFTCSLLACNFCCFHIIFFMFASYFYCHYYYYLSSVYCVIIHVEVWQTKEKRSEFLSSDVTDIKEL